jgi:glycosyltransferase involved in cell wall biosynthesis
MKKIAYFLAHDINKNDGVTKKINVQINFWKNQGILVEVFCIVPQSGSSDLHARQYKSKGALAQRLLLMNNLYEDILRFSPDVIYYRYDTWNLTLHKLMKNFCVVSELNTNDLGEVSLLLSKEKTLKSLLRYIAFKVLRGQLIKGLSGLIGVTAELINLPQNKKFNIRSAYFPNSINLDTYQTHKKKDTVFQNKNISLFFMGSPDQEWHGVDIIEKLACSLPNFDFHIVGDSGVDTENVFYYGYLAQEQYLKILEKCHICIGTLALYRKNLTEASPLKVREYLAYGYPIVIGYHDTAFLGKKLPPWVHLVDKEININELEQFVIANANTVITPDELDVISCDIIEIKRLSFFKTCFLHYTG